ncbi:hypothetical protein PUMCH_001884 [Australozyma saopauloensis]|uniref:Uncharacterized protein n=1 Tax=Australozyma saopauloensis TaxID=291208 RepID=A0AAX4H7U0_9ASCO|nr:hypothetical protein PUMCH_001884 [[Candida] saopauloensis]
MLRTVNKSPIGLHVRNYLRVTLPRRLKHSVIGIDLGTTNSAVAIVEGKVPKILENEEGGRTTPSVVAYTKDGKKLVGEAAKRQALVNPENTFFATKRFIGRQFADPRLQNSLSNIPYKVVANGNGDACVATDTGKVMSPIEVASDILVKMKSIADTHTATPTKHAVVTVPAYFDDLQRQATKLAGELAGLEVLRVLNEPTAAALAYGIDKKQNDGIVAVYDFGGGTFDISILDIEDHVFEVRATNGDTHLGGEDFDNALTEHILKDFLSKNGPVELSLLAMQRIKEAAEKCKIELSHKKEACVTIPFVTKDKHIEMTVTEEELDTMTADLINATINPVQRCLRDAELKPSEVDEVIMVGGMTRMPKIRSVVEELFRKKPNTEVNPDEAVALGAAIQAAVLSGQLKDVVLLDVAPLTLGIETYGGLFSPLIPRNTAIPVKKEQNFSTAVDGQTGVDISVYQGERPMVQDNKLIGKFKLANIPPGPKGTPVITVSFDINVDGILKVSAYDKTPYPVDLPHHGKPQQVSIEVAAQTGFSEAEISEILAQKEANAKRDEEFKNYVAHANRVDILCMDAENAVLQFGKLMEEEEKAAVNSKIAALRKKVQEIRGHKTLHDINLLNEEVNDLQTVCMKAIQGVAAKQQKEGST